MHRHCHVLCFVTSQHRIKIDIYIYFRVCIISFREHNFQHFIFLLLWSKQQTRKNNKPLLCVCVFTPLNLIFCRAFCSNHSWSLLCINPYELATPYHWDFCPFLKAKLPQIFPVKWFPLVTNNLLWQYAVVHCSVRRQTINPVPNYWEIETSFAQKYPRIYYHPSSPRSNQFSSPFWWKTLPQNNGATTFHCWDGTLAAIKCLNFSTRHSAFNGGQRFQLKILFYWNIILGLNTSIF